MSFDTLGVQHLSRVFDAATLADLRADLDALALDSHPWMGPRGKTGSLLTRPNLHTREVWAQALATPALVDPLRAILKSPPTIAESMAIVKPPVDGQPFPWHQDSAYYGDPKRTYVIATLYLDDSTEDNGPILFLAGSHTKGVRPHDPSGGKKVLHLSPSPEEIINPHAKAGDVTLAHFHTVHGSKPNTSGASRRQIRVVFTT